MGLVSNMKARLDKQHRANAKKGNKMRKTRKNNVNTNMKNARNSGKFGSDLTNARVSMRGFVMPPRPKSPPPPPPSAPSAPKKKPRVCNSAYAKNLEARGSPLPECRLKGAGKRRTRRKPKRRRSKTKRRRTKRRRRTRRRRRR